MRKSKYQDPFVPQPGFNGLSEVDFNTLSRYNSERNRGIMHTPEWQEKMKKLQETFDAGERARYEDHLTTVRPSC